MTATMFRRSLVTVAAAGVLALAGCGAAGADATSAASTAAAAPAAAAGAPSPSAAGLPDVCELLTNADVTALTSHSVSQVDQDGLDATAPTRHCQWQLDSGDLAVFLSTTNETDFKVRDPAAVDVSGIGDEAYTSSGHLFVRAGEKQLDVYATGASDDAGNITVATATAQKLLPKI
jgi:hypothetical protein